MNKPFSGWKEGLPFYGSVLLFAALAWFVLGMAWLATVLGILGVAMALFFRDFPRAITAAPNEVVSPADGKVVAIEDLEETPHYEGPCRRVSIFLSVFDVHVNRAPYAGAVTAVKYAPGQFKDARLPETSKINESNAVWMATDHGPMTVRQISGAVARRIVCPIAEGAVLAKGEKFGMIRFGSRTELYLPAGTEVTVELNQMVRAGTTIMARFP
ncbi:MAG: phosphatidylserine decarboxylase family protein [Candidatus Hydrogenedentes bacterium]|nr:phosphatidylserine decarboxylase family protein [Candidatus Hydrogenedentota bacterium]